jgi:hypothetical protein
LTDISQSTSEIVTRARPIALPHVSGIGSAMVTIRWALPILSCVAACTSEASTAEPPLEEAGGSRGGARVQDAGTAGRANAGGGGTSSAAGGASNGARPATMSGGAPGASGSTAASGGVAGGGWAGMDGGPANTGGAMDAGVDAGGSGGAVGFAFVHPGILVSRGQLDFVKAKIAAKQEPWTSELARALAGKYGRLPYTPHPIATMKCGNGSNPLDQGCTASRDDAVAAYTQALAWHYTGDAKYATSAIAILDAWASTLKEIVFDPKNVSSDPGQNNGPLQAAWLAESFPRSAEILRHMGSGWGESKAIAFGKMMHDVFLPKIVDGWGYQANWNLSMANGTIAVGVYTDDEALFQKGVARFRERVPLNVYLASDGAMPKAPPGYSTQQLVDGWYGQSNFAGRGGHTQETCRDFSHTQMGLASTIYAAETAGHQGVDLYGEQQARIVASHEYIAKHLNLYPSPTERTISVDASFCGGTIKPHDVPVWEIVYNHYAGRKGLAMPESKVTRDRIRAVTGNYATVTNLQIAWEALTHADSGSAGYP